MALTAYQNILTKAGRQAQEDKDTYTSTPTLRVLVELMADLRERKLPGWAYSDFCAFFPPEKVCQWFTRRPELRQELVTSMTGLKPELTAALASLVQAQLVGLALRIGGDEAAKDYVDTIDLSRLVVHGPAHEIWNTVAEVLKGQQENPAVRSVLGAFICACMKVHVQQQDGSDGDAIFTALDVLEAVQDVWDEYLPLHVRKDVTVHRRAHERNPNKGRWTAAMEFEVVTWEVIEGCFPACVLLQVAQSAARKAGFVLPVSQSEEEQPPAVAAQETAAAPLSSDGGALQAGDAEDGGGDEPVVVVAVVAEQPGPDDLEEEGQVYPSEKRLT